MANLTLMFTIQNFSLQEKISYLRKKHLFTSNDTDLYSELVHGDEVSSDAIDFINWGNCGDFFEEKGSSFEQHMYDVDLIDDYERAYGQGPTPREELNKTTLEIIANLKQVVEGIPKGPDESDLWE